MKDNPVHKFEIGGPQDMAHAVYEMVHHGIGLIPGHDGMACCELAGSGALGAMLNLATTICKKPKQLPIGRIPKSDAVAVFRSLRTELLVFVGLLSAHQFDEIHEHDGDHMALAARFGPTVFGLALAQWQKLYPHLNIEDYLEKPVADMAKAELNNAENHLYGETHSVRPYDGRFLLKNNGSIN